VGVWEIPEGTGGIGYPKEGGTETSNGSCRGKLEKLVVRKEKKNFSNIDNLNILGLKSHVTFLKEAFSGRVGKKERVKKGGKLKEG